MRESNYGIAVRGYATSFAESELPKEYAAEFRNIYINAAGGAELRQGPIQFGQSINGNFTVTGLHELVPQLGNPILFASGSGNIWSYNETTQTFSKLPIFTFTNRTTRLQSVQMGEKLIFYNGIDRQMYTVDGVNFYELKPLSLTGDTATGTSATRFADSTIANFILNTKIAPNDLVFYVDLNAYGMVTTVTSAFVGHSPVGSAAIGLGHSTIGNPTPAMRYQVIDLVELNIIPTEDPTILDNTGLASTGTDATHIAVSGVNFITEPIHIGDWIFNTTRNAICQVTAIATALGTTGITGQIPLDSLVFMKSALPVSSSMHVHFGRLYCVDARDPKTIYFSSPADPQDFTTDTGLLQISTLQPEGDIVKSMATFQRFLVIGGTRTVYFYQGVDPTDLANFTPLGSLPQGLVSQFAMLTIGNQLIYFSPDGMQASSLIQYATQFGRDPLSIQLNTTLRDALRANAEADIQVVHYPKRSWVLAKVGSDLFVYNYTPNITRANPVINADDAIHSTGSWSLFDGPFANQKCYYVRKNGDLLCGGLSGVVGIFDQNNFTDYGAPINWRYKTGWLTTIDPKINVKQKKGLYIKPLIEASSEQTITIDAAAPFEISSTDTLTFTASTGVAAIGVFKIGTNAIGGSGVSNIKYPLRWLGERFRLDWQGSTTTGPLVLASYTVYSEQWGIL